jgi:hypothetical protein
MATATRIAKHTAKTYQSVLCVRKRTQDKLDALLAPQAAAVQMAIKSLKQRLIYIYRYSGCFII